MVTEMLSAGLDTEDADEDEGEGASRSEGMVGLCGGCLQSLCVDDCSRLEEESFSLESWLPIVNTAIIYI